MKKIFLFFAALAASQLSQAASSDCAVLNRTADRNGAVYSPVLGKMPSTFIIKGDHVTAYQNYNGYDYVMFINDKTGVSTEGWVWAKDLRTTGTMGAARY